MGWLRMLTREGAGALDRYFSSPWEAFFPTFLRVPGRRRRGGARRRPGSLRWMGSAPSRVRTHKNEGIWALPGAGTRKMQGSGDPPGDGFGRSGRRTHKNVGIWAPPCTWTRKNARIRTRRVSGSSCTGAWPAWWRRPGHSEASTGRLLGRPLQREVHAARATAGRARLSAHGRARGLVEMYGSGMRRTWKM